MTLITAKKRIEPRWSPGDLVGAAEAARLLGYRSAKQFQDAERLRVMVKEFERHGCTLRADIRINGSRRFLRREIERFLDAVTGANFFEEEQGKGAKR